jgi:hypothetical protein
MRIRANMTCAPIKLALQALIILIIIIATANILMLIISLVADDDDAHGNKAASTLQRPHQFRYRKER